MIDGIDCVKPMDETQEGGEEGIGRKKE